MPFREVPGADRLRAGALGARLVCLECICLECTCLKCTCPKVKYTPARASRYASQSYGGYAKDMPMLFRTRHGGRPRGAPVARLD